MVKFLSAFFLVLCLIVCINKPSLFHVFSDVNKKTCIVIDVGHGGIDPGKVSSTGILEKDINLQIALMLKKELQKNKITVFLTRENDCGLYDENVSNKKRSDLNNRLQFLRNKKADFMISIHQNSYSNPQPHGAQTFYFTDSSMGKELAETIQSSLQEMDSTNHRKAKPSSSYYLLKKSSIPSIIIECGFLSNPEEAEKLNDSDYQKKLAHSICLGFIKYLEKNRAAFY